MRRNKERSKQGQTNNKAEQHITPKAVTFPKKNEPPRVGLEPTTLYTLDRALYHVHVILKEVFRLVVPSYGMCVCFYVCACVCSVPHFFN